MLAHIERIILGLTDPGEKLRRNINRYQRYASHVKSDDTRAEMNALIQSCEDALKGKKQDEADKFFSELRNRFLKARYANDVYKYEGIKGGFLAFFYLFFFAAVLIYGLQYLSLSSDEERFARWMGAILVALSAGGIAGVVMVGTKLVGVTVETDAVTNQVTWYLFKPVLASLMGFAVFAILHSGLLVIVEKPNPAGPYGIFIIGFLGGYLEQFSTDLLEKTANNLKRQEARPKPIE